MNWDEFCRQYRQRSIFFRLSRIKGRVESRIEALAEGPMDGGPRSLADWERTTGHQVRPARWLQPGQFLLANEIWYVSDRQVLPDGWDIWPIRSDPGMHLNMAWSAEWCPL